MAEDAIALAVGVEMKCLTCAAWHPLIESGSASPGGADRAMLYYRCPTQTTGLFYAGMVGLVSHRKVRRPRE